MIRHRRSNNRCYSLGFAFLLLFIACCSDQEAETMEQKYDNAIQFMDKGTGEQAIPLFQAVIDENPGTRYAAYSYLKLGDAYMQKGAGSYDDAETNYRVFLSYSSHSHLVPYVLSRLIELNYKKNISQLFGPEYAYSRDPDHFKKIITEYQRFYFLYPESLYLKDSEEYLVNSIEALAEHELLIGDWYFDHSLYTPAIARYSYVLRHYPNFFKWETVVQQLIVSYQKNQQPELAEEMERVYRLKNK